MTTEQKSVEPKSRNRLTYSIFTVVYNITLKYIEIKKFIAGNIRRLN